MEAYRQPTPASLRGARVVTPEEAFAIWRGREAVFIDVMPRAPKPDGLAPGTVWRETPHLTIPGAAWLPNVGYGRLAAATDDYFRRSLEALTAGDKTRPLLFFCLPDCWMSWNAAKRAREDYGYAEVIWFPQGAGGWVFPEAGLVEATPHP
jgi:PQQ-dependent catabolism-associated CXXCW motif protein